MVMPKSYDDLVKRLALERKGQLDKNGNPIDPNAPKRMQFEATMVAMGAQEASQIMERKAREREEGNKVDSDKFRAELKALGPPPLPPKRRGRPKGSRNKPKPPK